MLPHELYDPNSGQLDLGRVAPARKMRVRTFGILCGASPLPTNQRTKMAIPVPFLIWQRMNLTRINFSLWIWV